MKTPESTIKIFEDGIRRAQSSLGMNDTYDEQLSHYIEVHEALIETCKRVLKSRP